MCVGERKGAESQHLEVCFLIQTLDCRASVMVLKYSLCALGMNRILEAEFWMNQRRAL